MHNFCLCTVAIHYNICVQLYAVVLCSAKYLSVHSCRTHTSAVLQIFTYIGCMCTVAVYYIFVQLYTVVLCFVHRCAVSVQSALRHFPWPFSPLLFKQPASTLALLLQPSEKYSFKFWRMRLNLHRKLLQAISTHTCKRIPNMFFWDIFVLRLESACHEYDVRHEKFSLRTLFTKVFPIWGVA